LLLNSIGRSVFVLNTTVVGLDAVERGHPKPDNLDISWNPQDRRIASRQSRKFVLEAVLVRASEAVFQYVAALSKLPRFAPVTDKWTSNTSDAEKVYDILASTVDDEYLASAAAVIVHWRNRIVHEGSKAKPTAVQKAALRSSEQEISDRYSALSVDCLLCHFEEGRPSLKDVSSLIAMSINAARQADRGIHANLTKDELDAWLAHYGLVPKLARVRAESSPAKLDASIYRVLQAEAPLLRHAYRLHYG
jgi:predicted HTH domain antitoxin